MKEGSMGVPLLKNSEKARIVDFWIAIYIKSNRKHFPLTTRVQKVQNIIENLIIGYFVPCSASSAGNVF